MKLIKVLSRAALLPAMVALGAGSLQAETVSQSNGVTTIRGVDDVATAEQRQLTRGRSGVSVFRGTSSEAAPAPVVVEAPAPTLVLSGENLWFYDPARNAVRACSLWYDYYGNRTVRCSSDY